MSDIRDFALPDLGEGLEEGEIVAWYVEVGDVVELNQTVVDVETAKAVVAVPSPFAGTVVEKLGAVGESLTVGSVLLRVDVAAANGAAGGGPDKASAGPARSTGLDAEEEPQPLVGYGQGPARTRRRRGGRPEEPPVSDREPVAVRPLAKPPVRKLARDLGVELETLAPGSGPDGLILREDVEAAAGQGTAPAPARRTPGAGPQVPPAAPPVAGFRGRVPGEVEPIRGIRKRIVERMERSRREIPEATCSRDVDLSELMDLRRTLTTLAREQGHEVSVTPFVLLMRATVVALRRFPTLNARIDRDAGEIHLLEHVNLGVAVDTDRGLLVPNVADAHTCSTLELALRLQELAMRAREGSLTPAELTGGTFTVNNFGAFGIEDGNPIINHPEGAILGLGAIRERPWVVDGELRVRQVARLTLAFDHRISDGGEAGRFLSHVAELCEQPTRLLLHL